MFTSFSTALSALNATSIAIDVVGNNLANLNTTGYKTSSVSFHDLVTQSLGSGLGTGLGETQLGAGIGSPTTIRQFTQGSLQTTSAPLDTAIQGAGFMIAKDKAGAIVYTRGGSLIVDKAGVLTTDTGQPIQGWTGVNGVVNTNNAIGNITLPVGSSNAPVATQNFSLDMNLNAAAVNAQPSGSFSSTIGVYDTLGVSHSVSINFTKSATPNQWDYTITSPDGTLTTNPSPGSLTFDQNGVLSSPAAGGTMPTVSITGLPDGAADMNFTWQLFNGTQSRFTQYNEASAVSANAQDGSPSSQLIRVGVSDGGQLVAQYTNGQQSVVGQIAVAAIRNPESLLAVGSNSYQLSTQSSTPAIGLPGTGGRGDVLGGTLESSTVDIAKQFTDLIVFQRGYQANAKVITTADELSQETIGLKR
jgi:flagellar hook protein FlgE